MNMSYKNIVLFIPHSSDKLDKSSWSGNIDRAVDRWTDWHTDKIFNSDKERVKKLVVPFSRFYCDTERLINDPMESIGQGIAYTRIEGCTRELSEQQKEEIHNAYSEIHEQLEDLAESGSLIIDCHSFPGDLAPDTDICVGFNDDDSHPSDEIINIVVEHFKKAGFKVGINNPYSNAMRVKASIPTFMIEFNKNVYLQLDGKTLKGDWKYINTLIKSLYRKLLEISEIRINDNNASQAREEYINQNIDFILGNMVDESVEKPSFGKLDRLGCAIAIINLFVDDRWENECYELSPKSKVILKNQIDVINEDLEKGIVPDDKLELAKLALENGRDILETSLPYNCPKTNS